INILPHSPPVRTPWEHTASRSGARCVPRTQRNTDSCTGPLCGQSVIT
ncbi:unnamed protein product, partial [Staurois parvus]